MPDDEPELESIESVFETSPEHAEYRLPDRSLLRTSPAGAPAKGDASAKTADLLVANALGVRRGGDRDGRDLRPARHPLRAPARARARRCRRSRG